jgi:hypothetical protein
MMEGAPRSKPSFPQAPYFDAEPAHSIFSQYVGSFVYGKRHGAGKHCDVPNDVSSPCFDGEWENDRKSGYTLHFLQLLQLLPLLIRFPS